MPRYATATPVTASGTLSGAGADFVFDGLAVMLTSSGEGDLVRISAYDGTDSTGTLLACVEAWYNQENKDTKRTGVVMLNPGLTATVGLYVLVYTETNGGSPTYKASAFWH